MKAKTMIAVSLVLVLLAATLVPIINSCNDADGNDEGSTTQPPPPLNLSYFIGSSFPHDTSSYTQGLAFHEGELYESTGHYGKSKLLQVDINTGKAIRKVDLDKKYFGEGLTILNDTIYQLTWKEKTVFAYDLKTFKVLKEFPLKTEGWGITHNGKNLIVTDGGSNLYFYEPGTFSLLRTQTVTESGTLAYNLNELEYVDGFVYANQYEKPYILKINPDSGTVVAKADLTEVWTRIQQKDPKAEVPNGIAYDSVSRKMYVTGKLWPEMYVIEFGRN